MTECRLCGPLECGEWHQAAETVHARLPFRYWAEELKTNQELAKAKHQAHRKEPDYRLNGSKGGAASRGVLRRKRLSLDQREKKARKARERRAAARKEKP